MRSLAALLVLTLACESETGALVVVDPTDTARVARIAVRIWDSEARLAGDHLVGVTAADHTEGTVELPWRIPLRPESGAADRSFRVEVDLLDDAWCPFARAKVSGLYEADETLELDARFVPLDTSECTAVFVDPSHASAADVPEACGDPATPCREVRYALSNYLAPGIAEVLYVRGGATYAAQSRADTAFYLGSLYYDGVTTVIDGEAGAPVVIRAWPGTGMPRFDGMGIVNTVLAACCGDGGSFLELDGLEVTGGIMFGVSFNTPTVTDDVLRNSWIHDNGLNLESVMSSEPPMPFGDRIDAGVIFLNDAARHRIESNLIENNGTPENLAVGIHAQADTSDLVLEGNWIVGNSSYGIRGWDSSTLAEGPIAARGNAVCSNGRDGISMTREGAVISNNSVFANGGVGIAAGDGASVIDNVVAGNTGMGIDAPIDPPGNHRFANGDMVDDGDPRIADPATCNVTPLGGSPLFGRASDGGAIGAF